MTHRLSLLLSLILLPTVAFALEIRPGPVFSDVRESAVESVGINLLAREGIVMGYVDGRFGPSRQVNRAEFLKIAMASIDKSVGVRRQGCFPDVQEQWYAPFVCAAHAEGVVAGYPDGFFHPERPVQYDEALKILTVLFYGEFGIPEMNHPRNWADPFYEAAHEKGTDLPMVIRFDDPLTRAQAARLIAGFLAESKGELQNFRAAESGRFDLLSSSSSSSSTSSTSSSSASSVSSSVTSSNSSSSSVAAPLFTLPLASHFLVVGTMSDAIAEVHVPSNPEHATLFSGQVKLFSESRAIEFLELVREDGTILQTLRRRTFSSPADYALTYDSIPSDTPATLEKDKGVRLLLRAKVRSTQNGGFSNELVQVRSVTLTTQGATSNDTKQIISTGPFPKHQTAFGKISRVSRTSPVSDTITSGTGRLISAFSFAGIGDPERPLSLTELVFTIERTGDFTVSGWSLLQLGSNRPVPCSFNDVASTVTCTRLRDSVDTIPMGSPPLILELRAAITVPAGVTNASLEASLIDPGSPENGGSISWTDGTGDFRWIEGKSPVARGTRWQ